MSSTGTTSQGSRSEEEVEKRSGRIEGYHAHVYRSPGEQGEDLARLHRQAQRELVEDRVGRLREEPVGPHPISMFQIAFDPPRLVALLPWLLANRGEHPVLIHPLHGDVRREHSLDAAWIGPPLELDLTAFD